MKFVKPPQNEFNLGVRIGRRFTVRVYKVGVDAMMPVAIVYVNYKFDRKWAPLPLSRCLQDVLFIFNIILNIAKRY